MIYQPYPLAVGLRYLRSRSRGRFISFISAVSMLGIALSVAVLIIVMAVISGFESELEQRILSVMPDASLFGYGRSGKQPLEDWPQLRDAALERDDILAVAPFVEGDALATAGDRLAPVLVRGVDPLADASVSTIAGRFTAGSLDGLAGDWTVAIGSQLAAALGVGLGDELSLYVPEIRVTRVGQINTYRVFTVAGIFNVGMAEFDRGLALVNFDDATKLYRTRGRASGISLKTRDSYNAEAIVYDFGNDMLGRYGIESLPETWSRRYSNIFRSIELTKPLLFIVLSLVMAIAAFNIVSTLFMVVREKRGDIAILRSIGSSPRSILNIFLVPGSTIGLIGMLGGLALGLLLVASLGTIVGWIEGWFSIDLLDADVYLIGDLPTEARIGEIVQICALALGLALLATIYPAWRAARQPPAEALRNE
jgi:lipoprotein-releasing system permease protein